MRIVTDDKGKVTGVEFQRMKLGAPDEQGRAGRSRWPAPSSSSSATPSSGRSARSGAVMDRVRAGEIRSNSSSRAAGPSRRRSTSSAPTSKVFASGDVRTGAATVVEAIGEARRASYAMDYWLRGHDLDDPQVRRIVTEPQPNFLTIVPFTDDVKEPQAIMGKLGRPSGRRTSTSTSSATRTTRRWPRRRAACSACEAIGHCDLREAAIEYETTLNMAIDERSIQDNPYVGVNHGYGRDETHSFILRDYSRCIDCGRCAQVCKDIVGAGCYDFIGKASTRW